MDQSKVLDLIKKVLDEADKRYDEAAKEKDVHLALRELGKGNGLIIAADIINGFFGRPSMSEQPGLATTSPESNSTI